MVTRKWLQQQTDLSGHSIDNLVKSEQLNIVSKGVYTRGSYVPTWQNVVYTLQHIVESDFIVGGLSALELKGFAHYIPHGKNRMLHLYGNDKLPIWATGMAPDTDFVRHTRTSLFASMDGTLSEKYTTTGFWREGLEELKISIPERASLEFMDQVPHGISFEHADQLMQGMTTLSPRSLQVLLEHCTNIKVKRLFLWFAKRHNYSWFRKLDQEKIDLGSGKRVVEKGGELDKSYLITVPKHFEL